MYILLKCTRSSLTLSIQLEVLQSNDVELLCVIIFCLSFFVRENVGILDEL